MQSLEETERLVQLGMVPADAVAGGLRFGADNDGFAAHLDGILDEVRRTAKSTLPSLEVQRRNCSFGLANAWQCMLFAS